ncbi:MAG TPA: hypothetical protein VEI47_07280 [Gemmatimonadales bacterium]|jgi:hypothetical protein|nr:hypothetical protein [Gemmatimonadales bacterium]
MRSFFRPAAWMALTATVLSSAATGLAAQQKVPKIADDQFYVGGLGGILIFETPTQTRGAIGLAGGQAFVSLNRVGLLLQVMEGFGGGAQTSQIFQTAAASPPAGALAPIGFHDIRIYNAMLIARPVRSMIEPYFGLGLALVQVVNPSPNGPFASQAAVDFTQSLAQRVGNFGAGSALAGIQFHLDRIAIFGQAQMFTAAPKKQVFDLVNDTLTVTGEGSLLQGATFGFSAGIRIGIGGARSSEAIKE